MFYITAFIATQEQVKPELKNEKSDTITQGCQVKTSNPAKAATMQNAHFASVSEQSTPKPAYDGQCIAGRRMARRAWPASALPDVHGRQAYGQQASIGRRFWAPKGKRGQNGRIGRTATMASKRKTHPTSL